MFTIYEAIHASKQKSLVLKVRAHFQVLVNLSTELGFETIKLRES